MAFQLSAVASVPIMAVGYQRSAMELKVDTVIMRGPLRRGGPLQNRKPQRLMYYQGSCLQPQRLCPSCSRSQLDEAVEDQKQETASKQHSSKLPGAAQDTWIDEQDSGCSGVDGSFKGRSLSVDGSRRPSFQPGMEGAFTVRGKLFTHRVQVDLGDGSSLTVRALDGAWLEGTRDILCDAFSDAMGGLAGYKQYLHRQIGSYLAEHIQMPPLAVVLIATITSKATGPGSLRPGEQEEEQEALAGTLELSFNPATRSTYLTLNPPKTCSYLCNMAVAPEFRRRGYGATLLKAAESFAALAGKDDIYLHVRLQDDAAFKLYSSNGYEILDKDSWFVGLIGLDRRYLMRKLLSPGLQDMA